MKHLPIEDQKRTAIAAKGSVGVLARQALSALRGGRTDPRPAVRPDASSLARRLRRGALDGGVLGDDLRAALDAGWTVEAIAGQAVPAAAQDLGRAWADDSLSFADVSMAAARLQRALRDLSEMLPAPERGAAAQVAVLPGPSETHTMGTVALALRLLERGVGARVFAAAGDGAAAIDAQAAAVLATSPAAVFLSVSGTGRLQAAGRLTAALRRLDRDVPVILGGPAAADRDRVLAATGVDLVASDPDEALAWCGIETRRAARAPGT